MALAGAGIEEQVRMILCYICHIFSIRIFEQLTKDTALGHMGLPTDVAALVSYIRKNLNRYRDASGN